MQHANKESVRGRSNDEEWFAQNWGGVVSAHVDADRGLAVFAQIVAPLEAVVGRALRGPNRIMCVRAFRQSPDGFGQIAREALERSHTNPVGLLVRMVQAGDHLALDPAA